MRSLLVKPLSGRNARPCFHPRNLRPHKPERRPLRPRISPITLTFINKSDILFVCRSESLRWAGGLLCGRTVVTLPIQTIEHDLWGWRAAESGQSHLKNSSLGDLGWTAKGKLILNHSGDTSSMTYRLGLLDYLTLRKTNEG